MNNSLSIILGMSGASGTVYGLRALQFLLQSNCKVDFVISNSAIRVAYEELGLVFAQDSSLLKSYFLQTFKISDTSLLNIHLPADIGASIASGSYKTNGMIIMPCSMGTLAAIAHGTSDNLITRAADVCLKERRNLIITPREMPYSTIHLENMFKLSQYGAIIAPASPGFYHKPNTIDDMVDFVVGKVLDCFGFDHTLFKRWKENVETRA